MLFGLPCSDTAIKKQQLKNRILSYTFLALIFYTFYAYGLYKMCYNKKIIMYNCLHYAVALLPARKRAGGAGYGRKKYKGHYQGQGCRSR